MCEVETRMHMKDGWKTSRRESTLDTYTQTGGDCQHKD
jgi:hypothetical protein